GRRHLHRRGRGELGPGLHRLGRAGAAIPAPVPGVPALLRAQWSARGFERLSMNVDESSPLFKKTYGALAGGAIGDAMGQVTEMMLYPTIERVHGWIEDLRDTGSAARFSPNVAAGTYTDDTRLKHLFCEAII